MICFDKSISDRKGRSRLFPRLFLLGFLLYGLNAAAQEPDSVLSAKASKSTRQKTSVLASEKQDTVVFRFAPKRRMFWADYKGNAAAINSLTQSIRQHKLSIESGVIVKTCSDSLFSIGQKNCQLFVAKLRNFLDSHNRMVLY